MKSVEHTYGTKGASRYPSQLCPNCGAYVIAAIWSEQVSERCVRNIWSCDVCECEFETSAYLTTKQSGGQPQGTSV
jgi:ribosomal protein L37AE/L43A